MNRSDEEAVRDLIARSTMRGLRKTLLVSAIVFRKVPLWLALALRFSGVDATSSFRAIATLRRAQQ
jgi:hypothetical protein